MLSKKSIIISHSNYFYLDNSISPILSNTPIGDHKPMCEKNVKFDGSWVMLRFKITERVVIEIFVYISKLGYDTALSIMVFDINPLPLHFDGNIFSPVNLK